MSFLQFYSTAWALSLVLNVTEWINEWPVYKICRL